MDAAERAEARRLVAHVGTHDATMVGAVAFLAMLYIVGIWG